MSARDVNGATSTLGPGLPPTSAEDRGEPAGIARHDLLFLAALLVLLVFLAAEPLLSFAVFGSDSGEYYRLTSALAGTGAVPRGDAYFGWGFAYPDFPGTFVLSAAVSGALAVSTLAALQWVVPVVAVLSAAPLFLVFRRLCGQDTVAILGAGLGTIGLPRLFSIAHPAPLSLGDAFVVVGLWAFVEGRRDRRYYGFLAIDAAALLVTHHLSSYFLFIMALGGLVVLELMRPRAWSARYPLRELLFLGGFGLVVAAYWTLYAVSFVPVVGMGLGGLAVPSFGLVAAGFLALVGVSGLLIRWRRRHPARPMRVGYPSRRSLARDAAVLLAAITLVAGLLLLVPLPGTTQTTTPASVLWFVPLLLVVPVATGSRRYLSALRLGPLGLAWLIVLALSLVVAASVPSLGAVLEPSRHAEYAIVPLGLLAAVGSGAVVAALREQRGRRVAAAAALGLFVLVAANAAIAYPPPQDFGGFQEGLTFQDAALWGWAGLALPPGTVVASDHRLSSMLFGVDGVRATWDSTPGLFVGSSWANASAELNGSYAPHGALRAIDAVAVDQTMRSVGVALDPGQLARPMSPAADAWLGAPPFVPIYENGAQSVYWVAGPG